MTHPEFQRALNALAEQVEPRQPLPAPDAIWNQAHLRATWQRCEQATNPIRLADGIALAVCAATGIVLSFQGTIRIPRPMLWFAASLLFAAIAVATFLLRELFLDDSPRLRTRRTRRGFPAAT